VLDSVPQADDVEAPLLEWDIQKRAAECVHVEMHPGMIHGGLSDVDADHSFETCSSLVQKKPICAANLEDSASRGQVARHLVEVPLHRATERHLVANVIRVVDGREISLVVQFAEIVRSCSRPRHESARSTADENF
jgi:hypothetical protein